MSSNSVVGTLPRVTVQATQRSTPIFTDTIYYDATAVLTSDNYDKHIIASQPASTYISLTLPTAANAPVGTQIKITSDATSAGRTEIVGIDSGYIMGEGDSVTVAIILNADDVLEWVKTSELITPVSFRSEKNATTINSGVTTNYFSDNILLQNSDVIINDGTVNEKISPSHAGVYKVELFGYLSSVDINQSLTINVVQNNITTQLASLNATRNALTFYPFNVEYTWKHNGIRNDSNILTNIYFNFSNSGSQTVFLNQPRLLVTRLSIG